MTHGWMPKSKGEGLSLPGGGRGGKGEAACEGSWSHEVMETAAGFRLQCLASAAPARERLGKDLGKECKRRQSPEWSWTQGVKGEQLLPSDIMLLPLGGSRTREGLN